MPDTTSSSIKSTLLGAEMIEAMAAHPLAKLDPPPACLDSVLAMTNKLFGVQAKAVKEDDAELDEVYYLISAPTSASVEEAVAMNDEWHKNMLTIARNDSRYFRLMMDLQ